MINPEENFLQNVFTAKEKAVNAHKINNEIEACLQLMQSNNTKNIKFPVHFIAFAESIQHKLDKRENEILAHLTKKVLEFQNANTENFKIMLSLAQSQRERTEDAIKNFQAVAGVN